MCHQLAAKRELDFEGHNKSRSLEPAKLQHVEHILRRSASLLLGGLCDDERVSEEAELVEAIRDLRAWRAAFELDPRQRGRIHSVETLFAAVDTARLLRSGASGLREACEKARLLRKLRAWSILALCSKPVIRFFVLFSLTFSSNAVLHRA